MPKPTTFILLTAFFLAVGVGGFWAGTKFLNSRTEEPSSLQAASEQVENSLPPENAPAILTETVEVIAPSIGPLARYQELGKAEFYKKNTVSFKLKKDDAKELAVGQDVYLVGSDNEIAPLQAKIHRIAPGKKRDKIIVTLTEENPDPELLKYKYEAYSATHDEMNVRRIPRSALWTDNTGTPFVWKVWQNEQGQMTVGKIPADILFESGDLIAITQQTARTDHILLLAPPKDLKDG